MEIGIQIFDLQGKLHSSIILKTYAKKKTVKYPLNFMSLKCYYCVR